MKPIEHVLSAAAIGAAMTLPLPALAQTAVTGTAGAAQPATGEMTEAEVRKVDKDNQKITLKHGAIRNLDMPPMTMVFGVSNARLLDKVKAGDKVRFTATGEGGKYTVTELQPANRSE
jgi:Cu(I)/Ag(I) efflux system protein CusF